MNLSHARVVDEDAAAGEQDELAPPRRCSPRRSVSPGPATIGWSTAMAPTALGQAELQRGDYPQAAARTEEAIALFLPLEHSAIAGPRVLSRAYANLGRIAFAQNDLDLPPPRWRRRLLGHPSAVLPGVLVTRSVASGILPASAATWSRH